MIAAARESHDTYDLIRFTFDDGTSIAAGRTSSERWMLSHGDGWVHVDQLRQHGWIQCVDRGPACYGHTDYYVATSVVADLIGHPCTSGARS